MKIAIGADHRGYGLKETLSKWLEGRGYSLTDVGTHSTTSTDYSDYAFEVGRLVGSGEVDLGVLICGTGIGMSIAANKVKGVRAARVCNKKDAEMSRLHNNANVLCFGADLIDEALAQGILAAWLDAGFEGGRHERRIGKISAYEEC